MFLDRELVIVIVKLIMHSNEISIFEFSDFFQNFLKNVYLTSHLILTFLLYMVYRVIKRQFQGLVFTNWYIEPPIVKITELLTIQWSSLQGYSLNF